MNKQLLSSICLLLLSLYVVGGCAPKVQHASKAHKIAAKKSVSLDEYTLNLSLAKLELDSGSSYQDIAPRIEVLDSFFSANKMNKGLGEYETQPVAVFEYKRKANNYSRLMIVPISDNDNSPEPSLVEAIKKIDSKDFIVSNINVAVVTIKLTEPAAFQNKNGQDIYTQISTQLDQLMKTRKKLEILKEAQLQIHLCDVFTQNKFRDAAYISVENAKQTLAQASGSKGVDKATINSLVQKINAMEIEIHKNMPYTLSND